MEQSKRGSRNRAGAERSVAAQLYRADYICQRLWKMRHDLDPPKLDLTLDKLGKVLGDTRKAERCHEGRSYSHRKLEVFHEAMETVNPIFQGSHLRQLTWDLPQAVLEMLEDATDEDELPEYLVMLIDFLEDVDCGEVPDASAAG